MTSKRAILSKNAFYSTFFPTFLLGSDLYLKLIEGPKNGRKKVFLSNSALNFFTTWRPCRGRLILKWCSNESSDVFTAVYRESSNRSNENKKFPNDLLFLSENPYDTLWEIFFLHTNLGLKF